MVEDSDSFWREWVPDTESNLSRARHWLTTNRVKDKVTSAVQQTFEGGETEVGGAVKDSLRFTSTDGKEIDATFIFNMAGEDKFMVAAVNEWEKNTQPRYDRRTGDVVYDSVSRTSIEVKEAMGMPETISVDGNERRILKAFQEDVSLQAKRARDKDWSRFVKNDLDAQNRVAQEDKILGSVYSRRNVAILESYGVPVKDKNRYTNESIRHEEKLLEHAVRDLDAGDVGRGWWDKTEHKFVDWRTAAASGSINKGVLGKYGFTRNTLDAMFTSTPRGRITGFTTEGRQLLLT